MGGPPWLEDVGQGGGDRPESEGEAEFRKAGGHGPHAV
jgi:hypothetical protein